MTQNIMTLLLINILGQNATPRKTKKTRASLYRSMVGACVGNQFVSSVNGLTPLCNYSLAKSERSLTIKQESPDLHSANFAIPI